MSKITDEQRGQYWTMHKEYHDDATTPQRKKELMIKVQKLLNEMHPGMHQVMEVDDE